MKIKKHFSFGSKKQIWRIIISNSDKLILETRDMASKEVFFSSFDLIDGKKLFKELQLEEKSWIGIEDVVDDKIFLHKYDKPDLPNHRGITAFDIQSQKILWTNNDLIFLFANKEKIYCYKQGFEERYFYTLDNKSGELIDDFAADYKLVNELREKSGKEKNWSDYSYPENFNIAGAKEKVFIENIVAGKEISGNIEFIDYKNLLMFNFHTIKAGNIYNNNFMLFDKKSGKQLISEVLNSNASSLYTDSFFIYKNFLFLLKEKNEILIFTLE